jgi:hypothetical protein
VTGWQKPALLVALSSVIAWTAIYFLLHYHDALGSITAAVLGGLITTRIVAKLADRPHAATTLGEQPQRDQLVPLRPKCALTRAEWLEVLTGARSEFYIAGHSLGKWCDKDHHERFTTDLARILHHGEVTLVILHPGSQQLPRLQTATNTDYSKNIHKSLHVLEDFIAKLPVEHRQRLKISLLKDPLSLPYMLVGNEHTLITATYLASRDSDEMPCLTLDRKSDAAGAIYDDFHALADLGELFDP